MASQLTQVSTGVKQYGLTVLLSIVGVIIVWNLGNAGIRALTKPKATPTPQANVLFGQLEELQFKQIPQKSSGYQFVLETIDGNIPPLATPSAAVYEIAKKNAGLDYSEKSQLTAERAGLSKPLVQQISNSSFLFSDPIDQNRRMTYDFVYGNVEYKYENRNSYVALERGGTPSIETVKELAQGFIRNVNVELFTRLQSPTKAGLNSNGTYYYLEPATNQLQEVPTQPQANLTVLNIIQPPIGAYPVVSASTTESLMRFVYSGITASGRNSADPRLLEAQLTAWSINTKPQITATYPLKSPSQAWSELNQGQAYILNQTQSGDVYNVRNIYMAYFMPDVISKYIQPVWVFEGDKPTDSRFIFRAIVPAIISPYSASIQ